MELYSGSSAEFAALVYENRLTDILEHAFLEYFGRKPGHPEVNSWNNSLAAMRVIITERNLLDHGISLEYSLPLSSRRLDCLITGLDMEEVPQAVIVELKQWDAVEPSDLEECVTTFVAGVKRDVLHPSVQVGRYGQYLEDNVSAFSNGSVGLSSCAYLHNKNARDGGELFSDRHEAALRSSPLFCGDQKGAFGDFLEERLGRGHGQTILRQVKESPIRPARQLMHHVGELIKNQKTYVLLDEQQVVFQSVLHQAAESARTGRKTVLIAKGGPGTGKSVIALSLMGALLSREYHARHATGSKAFTKNIRRLVRGRGAELFGYFNSFSSTKANAVDVLILDESHRIRKTSANRFMRVEARPTKPQVDELIQAAKVSAFFLDDLQTVRPGEEGSVSLIEAAAKRNGARVIAYDLEAQFRCSGSEAYINWIDDVLGIRSTANPMWDDDDAFEVRIVESPTALRDLIRQRAAEGFSARLTAGFCWPWSDPRPDGTLVNDVTVGDLSMPWNAKDERGRIVGVPPAHLWVSDPRGIDQVGCVYTAQGFEYDYAGVIFGLDLRYDPERQTWVGDPRHSFDTVVKRAKDDFVSLVKHTYRVLLTRGMKGCYVHFLDGATQDYVLSRMTRSRSL